MAKRPAQAKRVVPEVRGAFLRALKQLEQDKVPLSDLLRKSFEEKPLETLTVLSRFIPKEMMIETADGDQAMLLFARIPSKDPLPRIEKEVIDVGTDPEAS